MDDFNAPDSHLAHNIPPYTPLRSLGHELGVMFGFMGACLVIMAAYVVLWRVCERKEEARRKERREEWVLGDLYASARGEEARRGVHEKDARGRVELPGENIGR